MRVLVTGAAGFLGLHLADFLSGKKVDLVLLDLALFDKTEYRRKATFVKGDIRDKKLMDKVTKKVDLVVHAAAALPLWRKEDIFEVNVGGTSNLLEASLKNKVKHFIYISSTAVYGIPTKHPVFENDPLIGVGPYGTSKIQAEKLCKEHRKRGLIVTVIRPKTFLGTHRLGVFEILFDWIKDGKQIPVVGYGNNRYQLLDVDDLVEAIYLFATAKNKIQVDDVFNIGAQKFGTVRQDLEALFRYARSGSRVLPTPAFWIKKTLWVLEQMRLSPLYQWVYETADKDSFVSINKLVKTLKWNPRYSNSDSLIKAYQWYLDNYKEIKSQTPGITHTVGWNQGILGFFKKWL